MSTRSNPSSSTPQNIPRAGTFACPWCGLTASAAADDGTRRRHCPSCLHARHVLDHVGGGARDCRGRMSPISVAVPRTGDWIVVHRCARCAGLTSSPVQPDDNRLVLMHVAVRPLAHPPFPLEAFGPVHRSGETGS
ncbi:RNHCP domain-containing protein [Streptomyces sp. SHP 1-2]|uniref:RNHCP domain-containing protein n=1 Tax=Streptomyces sp. SHP 1-2 TaxID=2769489 RepID=UPI002237140E|nr:RNHCP domain-containing protein [Streptomyces sp. SHP 1-2]MCW5253573.1 RNHCP domain-containing protein [Streptomyces sp. SHP 1-2]